MKVKTSDMGVPNHVAIIMDGNGRWAKRRLMPRHMGHRAGMKRMLALVEHAFEVGVRECTLFALSTENLSRPREELEGLYDLFRTYFTEHISTLVEKKIRLRVIGDFALIPEDVVVLIQRAERDTAACAMGNLNIAIGYGGRQDIVRACNAAVEEGKAQSLETFAQKLSTGGMSAVDLLIRTGGEKRLSNFLLFETAYAEIYFSDKMFPDFTEEDLDTALSDFAKRERRYGKV